MSVWNPGTAHTDEDDGSVIVDNSDYPTPATDVSTLDNDPAAILTD